ncbi:pathogenicity island protein [Staphylococcus aureus]|uniref:Pathogenicity island protein n=10 Tax=Staphylococcus aureus TaxID=1280 RepID=A0A2C9TNX4_STAAU|nr:hypothetical protein [Staphylococcus aureus]EFG41378.1 hypothetical protein SKAG_00215 [Staphylococcus aureus A9754]EFU27236.1 hypothetical protein CGSSa01_03965 [Staphylococcus aureus subsp. aureus CGS01]ENI25423.1 hypothetical protein SUU_01721 [Staphylococcus aureus HI010]ENI29162.1 hypothetical protein SUY_00584 [Staphylococcus aureus HI010B]ENI31810.1 hypothetical protein SW3_01030 [Staphylococcus aureus HI022]ENI33320.1 hypothetical protein SWA_00585 [Staphylococcus aureus HI013]ENI
MTEIVFYKIYFVVTPQLAHYCKLTFRQLLCWGPPQLALSVEFLFEILYVGAPPIIEKCLLHGHFHSVNYYQYNIVEPKTLIYYVLGSIPSFND